MNQQLFQWIQEAKKGDQEAFSELVKTFKGEVFRHAYAMVHDRMEAEDIAQEAFIKAYYSLPKLENEFAFSSWLTRIVSNLCYDKMKKNKNMHLTFLEEDDKISENRRSEIERSQTRITIQEAMKTLSLDHRTVLILRDIQGYNYDEIASILNISLGTVKSRIYSARAALQKELKRGEINE